MAVAVIGHNTCGHHYLGMSVSYLQYLLTCFRVLVFLDVAMDFNVNSALKSA